MRMLVLGGGLQGSACAWDLLRTTDAEVTLADARPETLPALLDQDRGARLRVAKVDARDAGAVRALMEGHVAAMSALPYYLNGALARIAVDIGVHFADLGGNTAIVREQQQLDARARERGVSIMPDCGLAPGMVNILAAEGIRRLDTVETVRCYVGGLPQHPQPPLNYTLVYSLEGVLDYYTAPSWILRDGRPVSVEALSEIETVHFPEPTGNLEAFHTAGGISTMPWDFEGRIPEMEYKTLRYPGHAEIIKAIRELGLLDVAEVNVGGVTIRPRDLFVALADRKLRQPEVRDLVALRVVVTGTRGGRASTVSFSLLDRYDEQHGIGAMMRTTGYSLSITGQLQVAGH
ncbi:MAG: saccharopine dehydrogenase NADP-binding domain-containing protein, partial [Gemmatimonadota bacterium]|nr:saccharopine dehydrogenase NADP-binding domain-containing protein [Gemmatimonadota bacterium]